MPEYVSTYNLLHIRRGSFQKSVICFALCIAEVDSGSSSDSEVEQEQRKERPKAFVFSDDEDDTKRVVRTLKDKRFEEMQTIIKQMKNHKKIRDMAKGKRT